MKKLVGFIAILSLWGCGPEQSAADRDRQQLEAQLQAYQALYNPFTGAYAGTITYQGEIVYQVSLGMTSTVSLTNNVGTISDVPTPTINGSFNICYYDKCFVTNANDTSNADTSSQVSFGYYDPTTHMLTLNTTPSNTNCSGIGAKSCAPGILNLQWTSASSTELTGVLKKAGSKDAQVDLIRQ